MSPAGPCGRSAPRVAASLVVSAVAWVGLGTLGAPPERTVAFPLKLEGLDGREVLVSPGAPVLHVVFFATWCPPCVDELRALADLEARWAGRGYRLVLVAVPTRQTRERLAAFVREASPPGEVLFDRTGSAERACGVERLPVHLLFEAKGQIVLRSENLADGVEAAVARILGGRRREGVR